MKITVIAVGKLKEKYWKEAVQEYTKRLSKYADISILEIPDEKEPNNASAKDIERIKEKEANKILSKIKENQHVVTLEIEGKTYTSEALSKRYETWQNTGKSSLAFVIGGSNGLHNKVLKKSHENISFGTMTFPHQMMRVMLLEQLFRVNKIVRNESYHK